MKIFFKSFKKLENTIVVFTEQRISGTNFLKSDIFLLNERFFRTNF